MRHWGLAAGVALGAALGLFLGRMDWTLDAGHVRRDLGGALGAPPSLSRATLRLLPRPTLRLTDVKWSAAGGAFQAQAARVDVALRFDKLLGGVFAPSAAALRDADLHVDLDAARAAYKALAGPPLARLTLENGTLALASAREAWTTKIDISGARLDWASSEGPLRARATGRWRSQPIEASAEFDTPLAAVQGGASAVRASLDAPLAQLRVAGEWSPEAGLDGALYRGQTSALIPSLARFARWIGQSAPAGAAPAGLELEAHVSADWRQIRLADAALALGGQNFEGALDLLRSPQGVSLSGTLAADALDLEPLIGPPPALIDEAGGWSKHAALPAPSGRIGLDLRVSASRAAWRGHVLENAAAAVSQRDGRLSVKLLEAGFANGSLSGEMSVEDVKGECQSRVAVSLENADLGAVLADFGERNFTGQGGLKASFHARGRAPADIVASADGEGSLDIVDGALRTLNFEEALRRGQRKMIDVARDMNAGATRFGAAHGRLEISNGEARFVDAATEAPGVSLAVTGAIDLSGRAWKAQVAARQSSEDGQPTPDGARLDFALFGPWSGPVLTPLLPPAE